MKVRQLNMNKSKLCNDHINHLAATDADTCIYALQEPYYRNGKIPNHPRGYKIIGANNESRAVFMVPDYLPLINSEFTSKDFTVCLYESGHDKCFFVNIYMDITLQNCISQQLINFCDFIEAHNYKAIFMLDSNAHSPLWGNEPINRRGEQVEEFIFGRNLKLLNVGTEPTFVTSRSQTTIDLTLVTSNCKNAHSWKLWKGLNFSDHRTIEFIVDFSVKPEKPMIKRVNWEGFKTAVEIDDRHYNLWSAETIEFECDQLLKVINTALEKSSFYTPLKRRSPNWWNDDLQKKKAKCQALYNKVLTTNNNGNSREEFEAYKQLYMADVRRSKRKSWKDYLNSIHEPESMNRLIKSLKGSQSHEIGILRKPDGSFTRSLKESIDLLLTTHFPDSVIISNDMVESPNSFISEHIRSVSNETNLGNNTTSPEVILTVPNRTDVSQIGITCTEEDLNSSFITLDIVKQSIYTFKPGKTGGPDSLRPIVFRYLPEMFLVRLTRLYQAMLKIGYTPMRWRTARVVFLAKPNKRDYYDPRSFRGITMSSFFIKIVEKCVLWQIETTVLKDNPLSKDQFGFVKLKSTETALSDLVDNIESSILRGGLHLACLLDIRGAFDHLIFDSVISAMAEKGIQSDIINWYGHYLKGRNVSTELKGQKSSVLLKRGCPQGGILSSISWALVFDSLLKELRKGPITIRCFADDLVASINGCDPSTMSRIMQRTLNKAVTWGQAHGLEFVPQKTVAIFFHRKRQLKEPQKLKMGNYEISYSQNATWLGILFDQRLTFKQHVEQKIIKVKRLIMKVRNAVGSYFGPSPKALKWAYNGIVLPSLTYGCLVWARACQDKTIRYKLSKLNRLMALSMMPIRKSSPTMGLEIILGLPPIDLTIEKKALEAMIRVKPHSRTKWDGLGNSSTGHLRWGEDMLNSCGIPTQSFDYTNVLNLNKGFKVDLDSFKSGLPQTNCNLSCYTDGSKMTSNAGYGFGIANSIDLVARGNGQLGKYNTVYQAEVTAIEKAVDELIEMKPEKVTIFSDSQAAIRSLDSTVQPCSIRII